MASSDNNIKSGYWLAEKANILPPERINTTYFTHLFYGFVGIDPRTHTLIITPPEEQLINTFIHRIHTGNPQPKAFLSIGGPNPIDGNIQSNVISEMARERQRRARFIRSTIEAAENYEFNGFDLAWEFPTASEDMDNMRFLFEEWHNQIRDHIPKLFLTARVYFSPTIRRRIPNIAYPIDSLNEHLDFLNVISYDHYLSTSVRGHVQDPLTTDVGILSWLRTTIPPNKLVLGIPLYGNKFTLADENDNGIGAPVVSYNGVVAYRAIPGRNNGTYDDPTKSEYVSHGTDWFGYDGPQSIPMKIEYARTTNRIGGYFLYSLGDDDDQYTLSNAAFNA